MEEPRSNRVRPAVLVVGDIGAKAVDTLEQAGLTVYVANGGAEVFSALATGVHLGLIVLDMRIPEQMLDMRIPEQMNLLIVAAQKVRASADVPVVVLSEFEEVREDLASGLFIRRSFDAATIRRIMQSPSLCPPPMSSRPQGAALSGGLAPGETPKVIMVVEDDSDLRSALAELLYDAGYEVATAAHGRAALSELSWSPRPSLVLLDMMMPELDGWGFMAEFKRDPELCSIPVVVVSAGSRAMFEATPGAAAYLSKPLDRGKLLRTIRTCLGEPRVSDPGPLS